MKAEHPMIQENPAPHKHPQNPMKAEDVILIHRRELRSEGRVKGKLYINHHDGVMFVSTAITKYKKYKSLAAILEDWEVVSDSDLGVSKDVLLTFKGNSDSLPKTLRRMVEVNQVLASLAWDKKHYKISVCGTGMVLLYDTMAQLQEDWEF